MKLGDYRIELPQSEQKKKIKIEAKMDLHGLFKLQQAHIVEIEEYEEIVKEKREIVEKEEEKAEEGAGQGGKADDVAMPDASPAPTESGASGTEGDAAAETAAAGEKKKEEKKPKYEWVEVKKPKTRTKRTALEV